LTSLTSYPSAAAMTSRVSSLQVWTRPFRMRFRVASVQSAAAAMARCGFPDSRTSLSRSSLRTGLLQKECKVKVSPTNLILVDDREGVDQCVRGSGFKPELPDCGKMLMRV
jgi:hypothetical protein